MGLPPRGLSLQRAMVEARRAMCLASSRVARLEVSLVRDKVFLVAVNPKIQWVVRVRTRKNHR